MRSLFVKAISLTILIIVTLIFTNLILPQLQEQYGADTELIILIVSGALLVIMGYWVVIKLGRVKK